MAAVVAALAVVTVVRWGAAGKAGSKAGTAAGSMAGSRSAMQRI